MNRIISAGESQQILRNLYRKDATAKYAEQLRGADPEERKIILSRIEAEVTERIKQQKIVGHGPFSV